jgi:hypothetical protein
MGGGCDLDLEEAIAPPFQLTPHNAQETQKKLGMGRVNFVLLFEDGA